MDSVKTVIMKLQANKKYKMGHFLYNMICLYALTGLACTLFCSNPFWFSSLSCYGKQILFYVPYIWSSFSNPKCLFIVANVIIVFLVGESNFVGPNSSSSPGDQYYDEYVERSRRRRGHVSSNYNLQEKKEETNLIEDSVCQVDDQVKEVSKKEVEIEKENEEKEKHKEEEKEEEEEEDDGLPAEELNKRVEEFIARVNKQRWLEARSGMKILIH